MAKELIPDVSLVDNAEERLPLVLVLDCSASMEGEKIAELQRGLEALKQDLNQDAKAARSVRILIVAFGGNDEVFVGAWQDVMDFVAPKKLKAHGKTPTGPAMMCALQEVENEKVRLRQHGIAYKRPLIYLMSDGEPTDEWEHAAEQCRVAEESRKAAIFSIAVGDDANHDILGEFSPRPPLQLQGLKFKELFLWLSQSVKAVSRGVQGQAVQLPPTASWSNYTV